jgi:hypothetical protein
MTHTTARVAWGAAQAGLTPGKASKADFLQLSQDGTYYVKMVGRLPCLYYEKWTKNVEGQDRSVVVGKHEPDAKARYAVEVFVLAEPGEKIGKQTGRPAILTFGRQIYDGISQVAAVTEQVGGDSAGMIIAIDRKKGRRPQMYICNNVPSNLTLNEEQSKLVDIFLSRPELDFAKLFAPLTSEQIQIRLGFVKAPNPSSEPQIVTASTPTPTTENFLAEPDDVWGDL